jgi:hypothetical protein
MASTPPLEPPPPEPAAAQRSGQRQRSPHSKASQASSQGLSAGTWAVGSALFVFFVLVFVFAPPTLPDYKQRMLAFASAMLAGVFSFLFVGDLAVNIEVAQSRFGRMAARGTGGFAAFALVLWWWLSPLAPVKSSDITAYVRYVAHADLLEVGQAMPDDIFAADTTLRIKAALPSANPARPGRVTELTSIKVTATQTGYRASAGGPGQAPVRLYEAFEGDKGRFDEPDNWEDATVSAVLTAEAVPHKEQWISWMTKLRKKSWDHSGQDYWKFYNIDPETDPRAEDIEPFPMGAELCIMLHGREVARLDGLVARIRRSDEDPAHPWVVNFKQESITGKPASACRSY